MILRNLNHAVVILGTQVHEVVIDGIHHFALHVYLVVQVRAGALARAAHSSDDLATHHPLAHFGAEVAQMGIPCPVAEAVVDDDGVAVTRLPPHLDDRAVARGVDIRTGIGREVHARMEAGSAVDGVDARTVSGSGLLQVLVGNGLDGGDALQHLVVVFTEFHYIVEGVRLDVQLFGEHVQSLRCVHHQFRICHVHQMLVAVGAAIARLADGFRYGVGLEDDPVEVVVAQLDVLQHSSHLVHPAVQHVILRLQSAVFLAELLLGRRAEKHQQADKASRHNAEVDKRPAQQAQHPLPDGGINAVICLCLRVIYIVNFTHRE